MKDSLFQLIVEKAASSEKHVRLVLGYLLIATIISAIGLWNSHKASWLSKRIAIHQNILQWPHSILENKKCDEAFREMYKGCEMAKLDSLEQELYDKASSYCVEMNYMNASEVRKELERMRDSRLQQVLFISIPIIGISFHVNDLAIFSGVSFLIGLFLLRFAYGIKFHRLTDARLALDDYLKGLSQDEIRSVKRYTGLLIEGGQIMELNVKRLFWKKSQFDPSDLTVENEGNESVESIQEETEKGDIPYSIYSEAFIWTPVTTLAVIIAHDLSTFFIGEMFSTYMTKVMFGASFALLVINIFITLNVLQKRKETITLSRSFLKDV